jgi:hypothetical protein
MNNETKRRIIMILASALSAVLAIGREIIDDPDVKKAIGADLLAIEQKVAGLEVKGAEGVDDIEAHIAGWLSDHYQITVPAAPQPAPAAPVTPSYPADQPPADGAVSAPLEVAGVADDAPATDASPIADTYPAADNSAPLA